MGMAPVVAAITIIFSMMVLGICVGHAFGWGRMDCIFLGGMLAMSSTTIIYKAFDDMGLRQQRFAGIVMSVLILEDVLAIVMMVMLSAIASGFQSRRWQNAGQRVQNRILPHSMVRHRNIPHSTIPAQDAQVDER
jgi:CPA2 family monovalent cation:H+ antiporter-2